MKANVYKTELPKQSILHERIEPTDFLDCFVVKSSLSARQSAEIVVQFPRWTRPLFAIRRMVTTPFGLLNNGPPAENKVGSWPVELDTEHEIIAGFDDKHQNFRISVISQSGQVYLATWTHTHNIWGRVYLFCILPFHIMIARDALKRVALQG